MMMLKEGETIQDKANQARSPAIDWIATTNIPKLVISTPEIAKLPASSFALGGVVDKPAGK